MQKLFELHHLKCSYDKQALGHQPKVVLDIEHLTFPYGKKIFIVGESGIGKSTILETLGLMNNTLMTEESSSFTFYGKEGGCVDLISLWKDGDNVLSSFRLCHFNFIFQSTNLMNNFTAYENVSFTRMLQGYSQESCFEKAREVLLDLGMEHIDESRMVHELSGGQRQRLAFARAILPDFTVLFGDEPTGNLDSENAVRVMQVLSKKMDEQKETSSAIIVSHDMHLAVSFADMIVKIRKVANSRKSDKEDLTYYGKVTEDCSFFPNEDRTLWTNGEIEMNNVEFEQFLRKKSDF